MHLHDILHNIDDNCTPTNTHIHKTSIPYHLAETYPHSYIILIKWIETIKGVTRLIALIFLFSQIVAKMTANESSVN